jgi:membrane protease YdiL (CAAX protease family)
VTEVVVSVRCRGCGALNATDVRACLSCGTLLPAPTRASAGLVVPATAPSPEEEQRARRALARTGGVARLFVGMLVLWVASVVAGKAGVPDAYADLAASALFAAIALGCVVAARAEVGLLLARTGGWRGALVAVIGFGVLVAFGWVYFGLVDHLGFAELRLTDPYLKVGWPRWAAYGLLSFSPGLFEELAFRGYVMARLDELLTERESLLVQAALFSLMHLGVIVFPSHFVIGVILGVVRRRTGSLYPGMAVHMGWNALIVWAELAGRQFP